MNEAETFISKLKNRSSHSRKAWVDAVIARREGIIVVMLTALFLSVLCVSVLFERRGEYGVTWLAAYVSTFILTVATLGIPYCVVESHLFRKHLQNRDIIFLAVLLSLGILITYCVNWLGFHLTNAPTLFSYSDTIHLMPLLFPVTSAPMIVVTFFSVAIAWAFSMVYSVFITFILGGRIAVFLYYILGSLFAIHVLYPYRDRIKPIRVGLWTGLFQGLLVICNLVLDGQVDMAVMTVYVLAAILGGIFAGIIASGFIPLVEYLFGYTTDTKLMELATMDHPLLRELLVQAPGTYQHSIIVGNMVEVAAKSIGANALIAKVAAYFHDIGKIKKPLYFIENQFGCENRHEKLAPSMSALILISHVKDGVELARKHKLGKEIIEIIGQHHGTNLISYFYNKALEAREKNQELKKGTELPPVKEEDFRYPGPRPQTKEAGLVMLADMAEAACRSLPNPTPSRICGMVNKVINQAFVDGQLDECELTLRDLNQIAKHFHQMLSTIHHKRIEYPQQESSQKAKEAGNGRDPDQKQPALSDRSEQTGTSGGVDLKRLGLS